MYQTKTVFLSTVAGVGLLASTAVFAGALDRGPMEQRYNPAAEQMLRIPGVVGQYEQDAMVTLQQAGLAPNIKYEKRELVDLAGKEWVVIKQIPAAGGVSMLGTVIEIVVYRPPSAGEHPPPPQFDVGYEEGVSDGFEPGPDEEYEEYEEYTEEAPLYEDSEALPQWGESTPVEGGWQPALGAETEIPEEAPPYSEPPPLPATNPPPSGGGGWVPPLGSPQSSTGTKQQPVVETLRRDTTARVPPIAIPPVVATQVQPTATRAETRTTRATNRSDQSEVGSSNTPVTIIASPVQQTVTARGTQSGQTAAESQQESSGGSDSTIVLATPVLPSATAHNNPVEWKVKPWQTPSWATIYNRLSNGGGRWPNLISYIRGIYQRAIMVGNAAIGNAPAYPNAHNPAGGTSGTFAVTVETPIGLLPCNKNAIGNSPVWMRMGFFYSCMDSFPLNGYYFRVPSNFAGLPGRGKSKTGTVVSGTYKRFFSGVSDKPITITVKKLAGRSAATVNGFMGDWAHFFKPWYCKFPKGKDNNGQTCSFTFRETSGRFIGVQITGRSTVNSFKYEISAR